MISLHDLFCRITIIYTFAHQCHYTTTMYVCYADVILICSLLLVLHLYFKVSFLNENLEINFIVAALTIIAPIISHHTSI